MGRVLRFGPARPEREPRSIGEWMDLYVGIRSERQPDPIADTVAELVRRFDPGGYLLTCPVAGCRWELVIPRMELDPMPLDVDPDGTGYTVYVEGVPREEVELRLAEHIDGHATDGAPPPVQPPGWEQQEWCDGGTCEHPACLDALARDWQEP